MTEEEAIAIAVPFYERETGRKAYLIGANQSPRFQNQWNVLFERRNPEGKVYEGAAIVNVYDNGEARFFAGSLQSAAKIPTNKPPELEAQISTTIVSTLDEAADIVAAYTHPDLLPRRLTVKLAKLYDAPSSQEKGSRFKIGDSTFSLVPDEDVAEAVHEITHGIEEAHPDVLAACKAFLLKRSEGQPPVDLSTLTHDPFDAGRMVYKDRWKDLGGEHYTGRAYENGTSTEILTTGITRLHKDPAAFAHEDPEFFSFIVKTLRKW